MKETDFKKNIDIIRAFLFKSSALIFLPRENIVLLHSSNIGTLSSGFRRLSCTRRELLSVSTSDTDIAETAEICGNYLTSALLCDT